MRHGEGRDIAERYYIEYQMCFAEIAEQVGRSEKTIRNWADAGGWREKRQKLLRTKLSTHEKLHDLVNALVDKTHDDVMSGEQVDTGRLYSIVNLAKTINGIYKYEEAQGQAAREKERSERQQSGGLSEDVLAQLEKQLGIL
jgi:uncharacterized protein YjcR